MNFELLRKVAETASGMRNEDLWFIVKDDTFTWVKVDPGKVPGASVIHVAKVDDPMPLVTAAFISDAAGPGINLMEVVVPAIGAYPGGVYPADAVFWSISAVEKFLLPYYASVYGDQAPEAVSRVLDILRPPIGAPVLDPTPYAIAHLPDSEYVGLPNTDNDGSIEGKSGKAYYDNLSLLKDGHAEPLSWYLRHHAGASAADPAGLDASGPGASGPDAPGASLRTAPGEAGAEPHSGSGIPRTSGSRSRYARTAGR